LFLALVGGCQLQEGAQSSTAETQSVALAKASGIPADPAWEHAAAVQNGHSKSIFSRTGVVGHGLGEDASGSPVIVILTETSGVQGLPSRIDGIPVVVEVSGKVSALAPPPTCTANPATRWTRPVPIGVSVGHSLITAGTIGSRVKDAAGNLFILSNNHVLANSNSAAPGDLTLQPGPYDGGVVPADAIGTLSDFQPMAFCDAAGIVCPANRIDAAIARVTAADVGKATPCNGYGTPKSTPAVAKARMKVKKYGRTTGFTTGSIFATNVTIKVGYGPDAMGVERVAQFTGQIYINKAGFSAGGDSGSLIVSDLGNPVALLFAGSSSSTIGNPIGEVLSRFNVSVDGI
jgi:hypothetical protein